MHNPYAASKVLWDLGKIKDLRRGNPVVPTQFHFVICDTCNHDCSFCSYRMSGHPSNALFAPPGVRNPRRWIETGTALEILDDMSAMGVKGVQFTGGGEPTVHPDHLAVFRHALDLGLKCALVTNGFVLRPGWEAILPEFAWIRVSVDAGRALTYAGMRGVGEGALVRTLGNVKRLADAIKAAGSECVLGVSFVVTRENYAECDDAARKARAAGAAYIRFGAIFTPENAAYYDGIEAECRRGVELAAAYRTEAFSVIDQFTNRLADLEQGTPNYSTCYYQRLCGYIGGDLGLYRCCNTSYNPIGFLGSLRDARLRDLWASDEVQRRLDDFDARSCERCHVNGKNQLLNAVVGVPTHPEFP